MSTTLSTLQTNISTYLNRSDLNTQITLALNRAIAYYARRYRFWFSETTSTFATVASQISYGTADSVPSDLANIDVLELALNSSQNIHINPITYDELQARNVGNINGIPEFYAYYKSRIFLYPIPDAAYTITISYLKNYPTDLSGASDSNNFTDNAQDLIEARACWWIYSRILKNTEAAANSKADELDALTALIGQNEKLVSSGKIRPTTF